MYPDLKKIKNYAKKYNRIPVYKEMNISSIDPLMVLKAMEGEENFIFLESAKGKKSMARFSYLCFNPSAVITAEEGVVTVCEKGEEKKVNTDVFTFIEKEILKYNSPDIRGYGDFNGGFTGYISYEAINYAGVLRSPVRMENHIPIAELLLIDDFIVADNLTGKYYIASAVYTERGDLESQFALLDSHFNELEKYITGFISNEKIPYLPSRPADVEMYYNESDQDFMNKIVSIKNYITSGEIIQAVLSRRMFVKNRVSPFRFYQKLRQVNPSPYMYFFKSGKRYIAGCSPETHIKIKKGKAFLKPIAGTALIPSDAIEKKMVRRDLLKDHKERAEHLMLVDLARNDLSRIAEKGSVNVKKFMKVEDYSHVMHIVSNVYAALPGSENVVRAFKNTFPAGTVSGAPKVRAIELINELEPEVRGAYAGTVGYFGFNRNCDTCITIRTAFFNEDSSYIQAGAGIVYDSEPAKEVEEINNKLMALTGSMGYAV
jgi:anthranilate synthase component 1